MSDATNTTGLQLRSRITKTGELELSLSEVAVPEPGPDQVVVKVEATPINPSDLGLLLGPVDMATAKSTGSGTGHQGHGEGGRGRPALPDGTARPGDAGRQRGRRHRGQGGLVGSGAGASRARRCRWSAARCMRSIACLKATDCQPLPAGTTRRRGRLVVRQSADRARHDRNDEARRPQGAGAHRGRLEPRPDAEQDLQRGRHRPGQRRAQPRAGQAAARHRRQARRRFERRRLHRRRSRRRWSRPAPRSPSTPSAAASSPARS